MSRKLDDQVEVYGCDQHLNEFVGTTSIGLPMMLWSEADVDDTVHDIECIRGDDLFVGSRWKDCESFVAQTRDYYAHKH